MLLRAGRLSISAEGNFLMILLLSATNRPISLITSQSMTLNFAACFDKQVPVLFVSCEPNTSTGVALYTFMRVVTHIDSWWW